MSFDGLGRLTSQTGALAGEPVSRSYSYDGLSRLKTAVGPWEKRRGSESAVTWTYSYDALGNLRGQVSSRPLTENGDHRIWRYHHPSKPHFLTELEQVGADSEQMGATPGGEAAWVDPGVAYSSELLVWNALGKLHGYKDSAYSYDAFGQRTLVVTGPSGSTASIVSVGEDFEYDIGAARANKHFSLSGVRIASLATSYVAESASVPPSVRIALHFGQPLAAPAAASLLALGLVGLASVALRRRTPVWLAAPGVGVLSFALVALPYTAQAATLTVGAGRYGRHAEPILAYLVDHLGTVRAAVNRDGIVVETRDYAPFGESISHVGAFSVQHRFTGQPQDDQEGGLYDYGARFYNPKWGRFVSPDEAVQGFDSQGLNPFAYVLNRPTSGTDPTGNFGDGGFGGGAFGGYGSLGYTAASTAGSGSTYGTSVFVGSLGYTCFIECTNQPPSELWWYNDSWSNPDPLLDLPRFGAAAPDPEFKLTQWTTRRLLDAITRIIDFFRSPFSRGRSTSQRPSTAKAGAEAAKVGPKIAKQMGPRGWTQKEIQEAIKSGKQVRAMNKATGNPATRYVHPKTGQSVVVDDVTGEVIHVGERGFKYGPGSGDLP